MVVASKGVSPLKSQGRPGCNVFPGEFRGSAAKAPKG